MEIADRLTAPDVRFEAGNRVLFRSRAVEMNEVLVELDEVSVKFVDSFFRGRKPSGNENGLRVHLAEHLVLQNGRSVRRDEPRVQWDEHSGENVTHLGQKVERPGLKTK